MTSVSRTALVAAHPDEVWAVLADFESSCVASIFVDDVVHRLLVLVQILGIAAMGLNPASA